MIQAHSVTYDDRLEARPFVTKHKYVLLDHALLRGDVIFKGALVRPRHDYIYDTAVLQLTTSGLAHLFILHLLLFLGHFLFAGPANGL